MTSQTSHSVLRSAALTSGLISPQQLDDALASLAPGAADPQHVVDQITDEQLGQRLVDLGYLNRWQVEQLKEGRTKFTLGPYRIVNAIGKGGMGHVFKAEHKLLGRVEAIKVLPKSKSTPEAVAAFQREIRGRPSSTTPTWSVYRTPISKVIRISLSPNSCRAPTCENWCAATVLCDFPWRPRSFLRRLKDCTMPTAAVWCIAM